MRSLWSGWVSWRLWKGDESGGEEGRGGVWLVFWKEMGRGEYHERRF